MLEAFIGQLIALGAFFVFPAIQYLTLKRFSRERANAQLWYLPAYGFRLVISNIPNKKKLSDLKYRSIIRKIMPAGSGSSVSTLLDETLSENEDFLLLGGYDQILVSFKINGSSDQTLIFALTDKIGNILKEIPFDKFDQIITDYSANIENFLNFDIKVLKRVILKGDSLIKHWHEVKANNIEQEFSIDRIIEVA